MNEDVANVLIMPVKVPVHIFLSFLQELLLWKGRVGKQKTHPKKPQKKTQKKTPLKSAFF